MHNYSEQRLLKSHHLVLLALNDIVIELDPRVFDQMVHWPRALLPLRSGGNHNGRSHWLRAAKSNAATEHPMKVRFNAREDIQIILAAFGVHALQIIAVFDEPSTISDHLIDRGTNNLLVLRAHNDLVIEHDAWLFSKV